MRGLTVRFGENVVVDRVDLQVSKGECVGLVGASGSGKSVTSLAIMRLLDPHHARISGSIKVEGEEVLHLDEEAFRSFRGKRIAMVFQEPMTALDPVYTVGEQVAEAARLHLKMDRKKARSLAIKLFEEVKLPEPEKIFDRYPHQLSGGQKQRVVIAMALSCSPSILICDEPTTALDVLVQREILDLLMKIQKEREMGMLFITHDLGVVREIADRASVMYKGRMVENAAVDELFDRPEHPYTKALIACRPDPRTHPERLPTLDEVMRSAGKGLQVPITVIGSEERRAHAERLQKQQPLLKVEGLGKSFAQGGGLFNKKRTPVQVLHDIGFSVFPGETLGIVGGSGSGKPTLGRSILLLIAPTSGHVHYRAKDGSVKDLAQLDPEEMRRLRRELQIIFQDPYSSLNPRITIGAAIMEAMRAHGLGTNERKRRDRVGELLSQVGLEPSHFNRFPHQFSGGQRQRIVIARAIALEPRLIICDESVAALDVSVQSQVLNLLNDLKDDHGFTYIFISHDLAVVKYFCDRILVLEKGRGVEIGLADDVYDRPQMPYTRSLIAAIPGQM